MNPAIQRLAEDLAEHEYGKPFKHLPEHIQEALLAAARDSVADEAIEAGDGESFDDEL